MATRRPRTSAKERFATAAQTAAVMHQQEQEVTAQLFAEREQSTFAPLDSIIDRAEDTRPLNQTHVQSLVDSIGVLGLLEPLVVDERLRLLAGGHRKAAITTLRATDYSKYEAHFPNDRVPIRIMPFDADKNPDKALQCEIAENEKRRDYSPTEIKAIADRLKAAGFIELKGRPKKGQKALMPALSVVVGKSIRRIQQYLENPDPIAKDDLSKSTKLFVLLQRAKRSVERSQALAIQLPKSDPLLESLENALLQVEDALNKIAELKR